MVEQPLGVGLRIQAGKAVSKPLSEQFEQTDADINRHAERFLRTFKAEVTKGYTGATHAVNKCLAEYEETTEKLESFRARIEALEADVGRLGEALEKAREAYAKLDCTKCQRSEP